MDCTEQGSFVAAALEYDNGVPVLLGLLDHVRNSITLTHLYCVLYKRLIVHTSALYKRLCFCLPCMLVWVVADMRDVAA